jgi:hypothetical protein
MSFYPPQLDDCTISTAQLARVMGRPRSTIAGWIMKYEWLNVAPVKSGASRKVSMRTLAVMALARQAISISPVVLDATRDALDLLNPHIEELYTESAAKAALETFEGETRPVFYERETKAYLMGREYFGSTFMLSVRNKSTEPTFTDLLDLAGFPVPTLIMPLDQTLRNAWNRALWVMNGIHLADEGRPD